MRIIIFANGVMEDPAAITERWVRPGGRIVAADGGTRHVLAAGLQPDHVIGDLDSLPVELRERLEARSTQFHVHPPAKDETDLELALLWASASMQAEDTLVILGALGGRPDQELANLLLLSLPPLAGLDVAIADAHWTVRVLRGGETRHWQGCPGDTFSLLPLGGPAVDVTTSGLAYPLNHETLHFGPARGVSNTFADASASVNLGEGLLWCFHRRSDDIAME